MTQPDEFMPERAANYESLAAFAAKTQEQWEDDLVGEQETRWGNNGVLGGLFSGLNKDKPFVAAIIEALVQEIFGDDGVFANVAEARAAARERFQQKWNDLVGARSIARLRASTANNFISDAKAETASFWIQAGTEHSQTEHKSGSHSVKVLRAAANRYLWFNTVDDGSVEPILSRGSESFYVEAWVLDAGTQQTYGSSDLVVRAINSETHEFTETVLDTFTAQAGTRNAWRKLSGYYTMPSSGYDTLSVGIKLPGNNATANDPVFVDDMLCREVTDHQVSWNRFWDGLNGSQNSSGKRAADVESAARTVRGWALNGYRLARSRIRSGTNLVADPGIDLMEAWVQPYCEQVDETVVDPYDSDYSLQITSAGSTKVDVYFNTNSDGEIEPIRARLFDWYYVEAYVFFPTTTPNGTVNLIAKLENSRNSNSSEQVIATKNFTTGQKGTWQLMSGYIKVTAGYNQVSAGIRLAAGATTADYPIFVDALLIRETTAAQRLFDLNKQRLRRGSSLLDDGNFDDPDFWVQPSTAQVGVTTVGSTTVTPRTGDYSLQVTSQGSTATEVFFNTIYDGTVEPIKASASDWYYAEVYCLSPGANADLTVQLVARFRNKRSGDTTDVVMATQSFTSTNENLWVKISGYAKVPLNRNQVSVGLVLPAGQSTSGNRIFLDGAFLTETTNAQRLFDISRKRSKRGSNLVTDSTFDSAEWWTQASVEQVGTVTIGGVSIPPRSGNFSLQVTSRGATATEVFFNTMYDGSVEPIKARLGELYLIECYCLSPVANSGLTVNLIARLGNAKTGATSDTVVDTITFTALTEGQWQRLWGYVQIPAGKNLISGGIVLPPGQSTSGDKLLLDDALIRESTTAQRLADALFDGFTGSSGSVGRDATEVFGAMGLVGDGTKALKLARQRAKVGPTFVNDPRVENSDYWTQPGAVQSEAYRRGGRYSLEVTSTKASNSSNGVATYCWFNTIDDGTVQPISTWLDDCLYIQAFYYAPTQTGTGTVELVVKAINSYTNATVETVLETVTVSEGGGWKKIFGVYTMPDGADGFSAGVKLSATGLTTQSPTFKTYFDSLMIREATAAQKLTDNIHNALTGQNSTGVTQSEVGTGLKTVFGKLFDGLSNNPEGTTPAQSGSGLFSAAKEARERAETGVSSAESAASFAAEIVEAGSNLLTNSDFENGLSPQPLVGTYSTEQKYSGSRSLKMTGSGSTKTFYLLSDGLTPRTIPVNPGTVYLFEMYVYASGVSGSTANGLRLLIEPISRAGGALTDTFYGQTVSTELNNTWTKIQAYITLPGENKTTPLNTVAKIKVAVQLRSTVSAGSFWIDQCSLREVTVAKAAQDSIDTKGRDFVNLAGGSDFEGGTQPWTLGTRWTIATDQAYAGTKSLKRIGSSIILPASEDGEELAVAAGTSTTSTLGGTFATLPNEKFLVEFYARRDSQLTETTTEKLTLINQAGTVIGTVFFGANVITANTWTLRSDTITIPAGTTSFTVAVSSSAEDGNVWLDNITIRRVIPENGIGTLPQSKITGLTGALDTIDLAVVTANDTAINASELATVVGASNNLVISPDFDEPTIRRFVNFTTAGLFTGSYSTDRYVTGSQSYKIVMNSAGAASDRGGLVLNPYKTDWDVVWFNIAPGEVYNYDFVYYLTGSSSKALHLVAGYKTLAGTMSADDVTTVSVTPVKNSWQRVTGTFTVPALVPATTGSPPLQMLVQVGFANGVVGAAGDTLYIDRCLIYRS